MATETTETLYYIKDDGWAHCEICGNEVKGLNLEATHRVAAEHLLHTHGIKLYEDDAAADDGTGMPYFIPPDRNGCGPLYSKRTDYGAWV